MDNVTQFPQQNTAQFDPIADAFASAVATVSPDSVLPLMFQLAHQSFPDHLGDLERIKNFHALVTYHSMLVQTLPVVSGFLKHEHKFILEEDSILMSSRLKNIRGEHLFTLSIEATSQPEEGWMGWESETQRKLSAVKREAHDHADLPTSMFGFLLDNIVSNRNGMVSNPRLTQSQPGVVDTLTCDVAFLHQDMHVGRLELTVSSHKYQLTLD